MALELFKPFIYSRLDAKGYSATVKQAKKLVEKERPEVWDILDEVIREHPVMLNRAPTLHRLGIQAFEPVLIEGKAIQLHPLVCSAFNADFDGDQMAVHVPLSLEAQLEARVLMMSTNNILSPANGKPIIVPSQDMVLGLYYLTLEKKGEPGEGMAFASMAELEHALHDGMVTLHSKVTMRFEQSDEDGDLSASCREHAGPHDDREPAAEGAGHLLRGGQPRAAQARHRRGDRHRLPPLRQKESVIFCDRIMSLGFQEAFKAGISFGKDDMVIPGQQMGDRRGDPPPGEGLRAAIHGRPDHPGREVQQGRRRLGEMHRQGRRRHDGEISAVQEDDAGRTEEPNSVYMMSHSGARGSPTQMRQLAAMRGLMAKPSGEIIETPIISNFKEGLTVGEYFNSTHGARKGSGRHGAQDGELGLSDPSPGRRRAGLHHQRERLRHRCRHHRRPVVDGGDVITSLSERILGRVLNEDVLDPTTNEVLYRARPHLVDETDSLAIERAGVQNVFIRSPLTCALKDGVCATCYGRDLARGTPVNVGEAVGIIAAQSIGEPGTQLTMRTFHIGGAAQVADQSFVEASQEGKLEIRNPT